MKVTTTRSRFGTKRRSYNQLLLLSVLAISYFSGVSAAPSGTEYEVCQSEKCKELANEYRTGMNVSIDPCNDFYGYVCGNWEETHPIEARSPKWSYWEIKGNRTNYRLREIVESVSIDGESTAVIKAKEFYNSCMDIDAIENEGVTGLMKYINETGGWPIIMSPDEWQLTAKPWQSVDNEYSAIMGSSNIADVIVVPDMKSSHKNILMVVVPAPKNFSPSPNLENPDDFFAEPEIANDVQLIKEIAGVMARARGSVVDENQVEEDARGIILFEHNLLAIQAKFAEIKEAPKESDVNSLLTFTTIGEFQAFYDLSAPTTASGKIDWLKRIQRLFAQTDSVTIDSSESIIVHSENYFHLLSGLLDRTPERDIVNTIQWWFVKKLLSHTNEETIQILKKYSGGKFPAADKRPPPLPPQARWLRCVATSIREPLAFAYVKIHFPEEAKAAAIDLINAIEMEMGNAIDRSEWLDDDSKSAAREKLAYITKLIGYPDWYKDSTALDERYEKLSIGSSYLENVLLFNRFRIQEILTTLRTPVDKKAWSVDPTEVNAFYSPLANSITVPAAFVQFPYFDVDYPVGVNYGAIGTVLGHEISHAFDNHGSQFDKDGNAISWWSNDTIAKFHKRTECFVNQFNKYGGNGFRTLDENIADSTGIRTSFETFKSQMKNSHYKDVRLPEFENFSPEQLYFLSYATSLCKYERPEAREMFAREEHSPSPLRVLGTLSNTEGFSEAFNCPKESRMNPSERCSIWH